MSEAYCDQESRAEAGLQRTLLVCIIYNQETETICKQLISVCRQFSIKHVVLPKFCQVSLASLFRVKRLTCFSVLDCFEESDVKMDFLKNALEFDNTVREGGDLGQLRYAKEQMFRPCRIKRWNVIKEITQKQN